jgi:hypothetical protein
MCIPTIYIFFKKKMIFNYAILINKKNKMKKKFSHRDRVFCFLAQLKKLTQWRKYLGI